MGKEDSVVKSFRVSEETYEKANEIFKKEGFSLSEVIRLLFDATIREGMIPRGLSTKDVESKHDKSKEREQYIDSILKMVGVVPEKQRSMTSEERLLNALFGEKKSSDLSNGEIRMWADRWGFPENISIATLAELHDAGIFTESPWDGDYVANVDPVEPCTNKRDESLQDALLMSLYENNIKDNLEQIKRQFQIRAIKCLMESNNANTLKEVLTNE